MYDLNKELDSIEKELMVEKLEKEVGKIYEEAERFSKQNETK